MFGWPGCCCGGLYTLRAVILGCNALPLEGVLFTASLSGNSYSGTTDATGIVDVPVPSLGSYDWTLTRSRFATLQSVYIPGVVDTRLPVTAPGTVQLNRTLLPATGYRCFNWESAGGAGTRKNALPIAETLYLTDSQWGSYTLTFTAAGTPKWESPAGNVSFAGCAAYPSCPPRLATFRYNLFQTQPATAGPLAIDTNGKTAGAENKCPARPVDDSPPGSVLSYNVQIGEAGEPGFSLTAPPSFLMVIVYDAADGAVNPVGKLYCDTPATITITE